MSVGFRGGLRAVVPLAVAVFGFGVSYGILARSAGMGVAAPLVMSLTTFAGSSQFAAASVLADGGSAATAVAAAVLLNSRYGPIGLSIAPDMSGPWWRRFLAAQLVVDESWAVGQRGDGAWDLDRVLGAGAGLYVAWAAGTIAGLLGGDLVGDPARLGLDAAFPALFLGLLLPQLRRRRMALAAVIGATVAVALVPLTPPGVPILASALGALAAWRRGDAPRETVDPAGVEGLP